MKKTLRFYNIKVNQKEFHASKQPIALNFADINEIVISDKFKHGDKGFGYFVGYPDDDIIKPLCIFLPQMSGYVKYFDNEGKIMSIKTENHCVLVKYNDIWKKIKEM